MVLATSNTGLTQKEKGEVSILIKAATKVKGTKVYPGNIIYCSVSDAKLLVGMRKAEYAKEPPEPVNTDEEEVVEAVEKEESEGF